MKNMPVEFLLMQKEYIEDFCKTEMTEYIPNLTVSEFDNPCFLQIQALVVSYLIMSTAMVDTDEADSFIKKLYYNFIEKQVGFSYDEFERFIYFPLV